MTEIEDYVHIDRILNGDNNAYSFLVDKYKGMAYTVALKIMRNTEDAEDVAQESFIKAFQKIHSFKRDAKFSTWLYTIVYRTAVYNLRKNKIPTEQINEHITENRSIEEKGTLELELQDQLISKCIKEAIYNLPRLESLLITLFYINENSIAEISKITDLSESNIKVKLYRARKKMKKELKGILTYWEMT